MADQYVSFKTPWGYFQSRDAAVAECVARGADPLTSIEAQAYPTDVIAETAYGTIMRISQPVRVF